MSATELLAAAKIHRDATTVSSNMVDGDHYSWALSLLDSSRLSTFVVSMSLIVYGSFRALKVESTAAKDGDDSTGKYLWDQCHTIESAQALLLPLGASVTLLIMFFFFDSLQYLFTLMTAVLATVAFSFLLLPVCQYLTSPCFTKNNKISLGACGRFTSAEIISLLVSSFIVLLWILTGHWLLMDALAMALCVAMIAFVRLPSLKVSVLLLFGLLVYDVFWVFFSQHIFNVNVMVRVATQPAYNPVNYVASKLHFPDSVRAPAQLSLPGKLVFPSSHKAGHFSMLGLGDIVMPGLFLCFVLRFDNYTKRMNLGEPSSRISYFHFALIGYFIGLVTATVASEISKSAQPALLYLVPFTILPLICRAYIKGDLWRMWQNPFGEKDKVRDLEV